MHSPAPGRYDTMPYRRAGRSGLSVPAVSLGLWQNFGTATPFAAQREIILHAFDRGVTHLDLANNYGPPPGSAEESVGRILRSDLAAHRDELVVATKAGYRMRPGPHGEGGSRAYLLPSLDTSLRRLGLDHVDIFYSHRYDPTTHLEETIGALGAAVESGRALHAGISSYSAARTREALEVADRIGVRLAVHQPSYSMVNRWIEQDDGDGSLLDVTADAGLGVLAFSPLAQGLLSEKYLDGVPPTSRAAAGGSFSRELLTDRTLTSVRELARIAAERGQTLPQLALTWCLRDARVTGVVVGARTVEQLDDSLAALESRPLSAAEIATIDSVAVDAGVNLWGPRSSDL
ncbi:aldo/keto reductase [Sanguibacter suaedae]|uniref:Aldo/keto reductase n=1 Tax=Sanguibacter suaedae TaxID=2795737 RepID=A0A934ICY9_9MICO|nr:aldo/keto reductase [Sanguibacter suaedae]MBI9115485.1 aldo/keto reductase [Sanguibacter suaedae]